jgi:hypothetical protein
MDPISGMTVNERLSQLGLFEAFDSAIASREVSAVVAVLKQVALTDKQAHETATAILADPGHYGF